MNGTGLDDGDELTILSREELTERVRQRTADLDNVMDTMVDVLVKLGPDGRIRLANAATYDVLGYEPGSLEGRPIDHILADSHGVPQRSATLGAAELVDVLVQEDRLTEVETALVTDDGETIPTSLSASVLRDDGGAIDGVVCVATDISERTEAEDRAAFLHSLLRHDLSNKLTTVHGYLELLAETGLNDEQRRLFTFAMDGVEEAIDLTENVRTLNRLDEDETIYPVDVVPIIETSVDRHTDLADKKGIDVRVDVDGAPRVVGGALLTELFANLIENALVHSRGSEIVLTVTERESTVRVTVDDDGRGIPPDRREAVLERGKTDGETGGTGLGTYLAARIADTYDGDLTAEESPLGGARFTVVLERASD